MLSFNKINLFQRDSVCAALEESGYQACEYSFCNMYSWSCVSKGYIARDKGGKYVFCAVSKKETVFLAPFGNGDMKSAVDSILEYCNEQEISFKMVGLTKECVDELSSMYSGRLNFFVERDTFDYIYNSDDLINLPGKKYHSKRNHLSKFLKKDHSVEKVSAENIKDCYVVLEEWIGSRLDHQNKQTDDCAVGKMLRNYEEMGLDGILVREEGRPIAFSLGERLNGDTYVVHVEKAVPNVDGVYQFVNQKMAETFCTDFRYVNREDDAGSEGLRKAKLSYKPEYLLEKFSAVLSDKE